MLKIYAILLVLMSMNVAHAKMSCKDANAKCAPAGKLSFKYQMSFLKFVLCGEENGNLPPGTENNPQCQKEAETFEADWNEWISAMKACNLNLDCPGWSGGTMATLGMIKSAGEKR